MNHTLEMALAMAARGFYVFPLQPNKKVPFVMDDTPPKLRSLAGGQHLATRDPDRIKRWFELEPNINYAVAATGLIIIDADVKHGNEAGLEDLLALGELPRTFISRTVSGGAHYIFSGPEVSQKDLAKTINIRSGSTGYIVAPGSRINGEAYSVYCDAPVSEIPEHIFEKLRARSDMVASQVPVVEFDQQLAVETAVEWIKAQPPVAQGHRNMTAFTHACRLKDFGLSAPMIREVLQEQWNAKNPEPLPEATISTLAENCFKSGRLAPGCSSPDEEFGDLLDDLQANPLGAIEIAKEEAAKRNPFGPVSPGRAAVDRPSRPWLVPGLLLKGAITLLSAQPGARKSTFLTGLCCCLAAGDLRPLGYEWQSEPLNSLLINNEDDEDEVDRRIEAFCTLHKFDYEEIKKHIFVYKPDDFEPFVAVRRSKKGKLHQSQVVSEQLIHTIDAHEIRVLIGDPLASLHDGIENDNAEMNRVMTLIAKIAKSKMIPIVIAHHSRKPDNASSASYAGDPFSSRGASAIHGAVRKMLTLNTASASDGLRLGLRGENEHLAFCRLDDAKDSNSPLGQNTKWFKCESVHVGHPDSSDTAPALNTVVMKASEAECMVDILHEALRGAPFDDMTGELKLADAVEYVGFELPATLEPDDIKGYLKKYFSLPQTREGVTFQFVKEGRTAKIVTKLNAGVDL